MDKIMIFSDGASKGNPGSGGWGAIVVKEDKVFEIGGAVKHTTNNRMEMLAVIESINKISEFDLVVEIFTDSRYVVNGFEKWMSGWKKRNWKTLAKEDVLNRDLWERLDEVSRGKKIIFKKISGHSGIPGNERADEIASSFAEGKTPDLFSGEINNYKIDIFSFKPNIENLEKKNRKNKNAYSYVCFLDGKISLFKDWISTEKFVKGKSGVRFKKSLSAEDEKEIIKNFTGR